MALKKLPITHVPVEGGPGGGKTSSFSFVASKAADWGIKTIFVPEAAREYFKSVGRGEDPVIQQASLLALQKAHESFFRTKAKEYQAAGHRVLVVYDRSYLSGKAYADDRLWKEALRKNKMTETWITQQYTNPIHLVTAADGAEEFYVNDTERTETVEQAKAIDKKLQKIWNGLADHFVIIPNQGKFEEKLENVWATMLEFMGLPIPIEKELWFSLDEKSFDPRKIPVDATCIYIEQDYLKVGDVEQRVRMKQLPNGERMFFFTEKRPIPGTTERFEREQIITEKQYKKLLLKKSLKHQTIKKNRYCFVHEYQYFELDEILSPDSGFRFKLEYSLTSVNKKASIPDLFLL